jgi:large subunit ribosomal protein L35Ae
MKGIIMNFRGGRHTQKNNQMIIKVDSIDSIEKAKKLIDKTVIWKTPKGNEIKGIISNTHGNKGIVRAIFEKGMPGQSLGKKVEVK